MPAVISRRAKKARRDGAPFGPSAPFLPHLVDVLDHLDGLLVVLVGYRDEFFVLAIGQAVESGLVLDRRRLECRSDRLLQIGRKVGGVGVRRPGSNADLKMIRKSPYFAMPLLAMRVKLESSSAFHQLVAQSTVPLSSAMTAFSWLPVTTNLLKKLSTSIPALFRKKRGAL
jgi:hypothetical protein